jgi:hypothetical protein
LRSKSLPDFLTLTLRATLRGLLALGAVCFRGAGLDVAFTFVVVRLRATGLDVVFAFVVVRFFAVTRGFAFALVVLRFFAVGAGVAFAFVVVRLRAPALLVAELLREALAFERVLLLTVLVVFAAI